MRPSRVALAVGLLIGFHGTVFGQPEASVTSRVANMRQHLSNIESALQTIETTKQIDDLTVGTRMDREFDYAVQEAKAAFEAALARVRQLNRAGAGNVDFLKQLDTDLKRERDRGEQITERMGAIDGAIRTGAIKLTPRAVQRLGPTERREFERSLTPQVQRQYRQEMPDLFTRPPIASLSDEEWQALQGCGACEKKTAAIRHANQPSLLSQIYDALTNGGLSNGVLVQPAHAALGIGCYGICAASLGTACVTCIVAAGGAAVVAYNTYVACKNLCCRCRWYKPWCCVCKGACFVAFISALA